MTISDLLDALEEGDERYYVTTQTFEETAEGASILDELKHEN